ncbi:AMP-binding protein [Acidiferrimicrobium sp. IK]|uniref:AMP-binding protein n=1 Tax=Acidiferrimicrobium sp. IK TaxID=2871700 RepID=UPI0021CB8C6C|nr:AMP-binding protein [Acidiferrimicrobium sp. IK]MCU4183469.1 AMP-binding protein [Acidiferrimicrobium sp. IK]
MNVGQMLSATARRLPDAPALTWGQRSVTYGELDRRSDALAAGLAAIGVTRQDRVGVLMRNRPELLEAMYACFKSGLCVVPLNARFTGPEVAYHLEDSGAAAIITDPASLDMALKAGVPGVEVVVADGPGGLPTGVHALDTLVSNHLGDRQRPVPVGRDDLAWLFYTSGTTGRPKGAMLTHANLSFAVASWLADLTPMDHTGVTLHAAPLSHGAGFHALAATARGAHQVLPPDGAFDGRAIVELMRQHGVTNTWLVPTQIVMILDAMAGEAIDLPALRQVVYGGAPFAPADLSRAVDAFGPVLVQLYGQGETPMTATVMPAADHVLPKDAAGPGHLASAGYPRPGVDVRILGGDDEELPLGEVGEICVQAPCVMLGYWQRPEETARTLRGGWLHTGDLGRQEADGYLYLMDRAKDMIISGGSNVYAMEVEAALAEHPAVRDVAVIGVEDRTWGQLVVAVVVTDLAEDQIADALDAHCREQLATYKRPRRFVVTGALPRNAYGKVDKRSLRERLTGL